jgi:glycosyltransferase involved in cell wall biosynthesis
MPTSARLPTVAVDLRALVPEATGIGVYTRSLLAELARRGTMRYLGLAHRPPRGAAALEQAGVTLEHQGAPLGVIWQQTRLPRRLAQGDVDLFWSPLLTLPLAGRVPAVATVPDLTAMLLPETHNWKVRTSLLPFLRPSLEKARVLVAISQATADDVAFHFPQCAGKIEVVYPGIDPEFRPGDAESIAATRRELGAPGGYVLYAGTLEPRKNLGVLLDAWEILSDELRDPPPLLLAGPYGWGSRGLVGRLARLAPAVRVLGRLPRPRLVAVFQAATAFVYPSLYEGFGLPPAEALACGLPVVVSDRSSLPEVVGDAGLRVAPRAEEIAGALLSILAHPARAAELSRRAVIQAARFTWPRAAQGMEGAFSRALAGGPV